MSGLGMNWLCRSVAALAFNPQVQHCMEMHSWSCAVAALPAGKGPQYSFVRF